MAGSAKFNKWLDMTISVVCILAPTAIIIPWQRLTKVTEFFQYYAISRLMQAGIYEQIYNAGAVRAIENALRLDFIHGYPIFIAPPVINWFFYPLAFLGFKEALYLWTFILLISTFCAYIMLCQFLGLRGNKKIWVAALLGAMGPLTISIWKGYLIPLLLLALVGLFVNLKKRNFLLASVYQSLFWFQPQLILPLLCFELGIGQPYTVIITFLFAIIGLLVSSLIGGVGIVNNWYQLFLKQIYNGSGLFAECTLQGQLLRFSVNGDFANHIAIVIYFVLLIGAFLLGKRVKGKQWQLSVLLTGLLPLSLCFSPHSSSYDLLLLFPGIIFLMLMPISNWLKYVRAVLIMSSFAILFVPFYMLINCRVIESSIYNPFFWLILIFGICALIIEKSVSGHSARVDS